MSVLDRFNEKWQEDENGCWIWTAAVSKSGYGGIRFNGKFDGAHRVSYVLFNGQIEKDLCVLHKCDVRLCVNPDHLFLGSRRANSADMVNKGRQAIGERVGTSKLCKADVELIRALAETQTQQAIADWFGVAQSLISAVVTRKIWSHVS